jgi:O-antigen ligase
LVNAGGLFPLWFCGLSLAVLLGDNTLKKNQKIWIGIAFAGWLFRLFVITLVRISAWLPAMIAMMIVIFLKSRKWFFALMIVSSIFLALNYQLVYKAIVQEKEKEGTLSGDTSRTNLWSQALQVSQDHLVLGTGPAGYANYYMTYFRDRALSTHNNYLDIILQYGLAGTFAFLWLCFTLIRELWRSMKLQKPGTFEHAFCTGAFAAACGMMPGMWLGDWVIPFAYNQTIAGFDYTGYNWVFIGLALALGRMKLEENIAARALD